MTDKMKKVLERTEETLCRHLEDLNDQVDADGGRMKDHKVLDGIKDALKSLWYKKEIMGGADAVKTAAKSMPTMM